MNNLSHVYVAIALLNSKRECPRCWGDGVVEWNDHEETCHICKGSGSVELKSRLEPPTGDK